MRNDAGENERLGVISDLPSSAELCRLLEWDSNFFGFRIGTNLSDLGPGDVPRLVSEAQEKQIRCLYLLANSDDAPMLGALEKYGFGWKDVRLTLRHPNPVSAGDAIGVRPVEESDIDELRRIARISHQDSRFYFDSRFPRDRCDDLYDMWITKSCRSKYADMVFVTDFKNSPAGYVTCKMVGPKRGQIGLLAMAPEARGAGLGQQLIRSALNWFVSQGAEDAITVTQGRNTGAVRAYERAGFLAEAMQLWYHRWLDGTQS